MAELLHQVRKRTLIYIIIIYYQQISWTAVQLPASPCGGQFSKNLNKSSNSQKKSTITKNPQILKINSQIHKRSKNPNYQDSKLVNSQKNIPKFTKRSPNLQKDPQIYKKIPKFTKRSPTSQKDPQIYKMIPKFPKRSSNSQKDPQIHKNLPKFPK